MSVYGEPYMFDGSYDLKENDLQKIWGTGSIYSASNSWSNGGNINKGTAANSNFAFKFESTVTLSKIIFMIYTDGHKNYNVEIGESTFTAGNINSGGKIY